MEVREELRNYKSEFGDITSDDMLGLINKPKGDTITDDGFKYYGAIYQILLNEDSIPIDVLNLKQGDNETNKAFAARKGKILAAYEENPDVDKQNGKPFRNFKKVEEKAKAEEPVVKGKPKMVFNKEQQEAIDKAVEFIKNGNPKDFFVIQGKAGTGKTTIVKEVLKDFGNKTIVAGALSNKAKAVLRNSIGKGRNISYHTIAGMTAQTMNEETGQFEPKTGKFVKYITGLTTPTFTYSIEHRQTIPGA